MSVIFLDTETQSTQDLKKVGGYNYVNHADTRLMSLVFKCGNDYCIWLPEKYTPNFCDDIDPSDFGIDVDIVLDRSNSLPSDWHAIFNDPASVLVAHNAGFDRMVCDRFFPSYTKGRWFDTVPRARAGGYPGDLDRLSQVLLGHGKHEGKEAMKMLTEIKYVRGKPKIPVGTRALWTSMIAYNIMDVIQLEAIYAAVKDFGEDDIIEVDRLINTYGIYIDKHLAHNILRMYTYNEAHSQDRLDDIMAGVNIRSHKQVKEWLVKEGFNVDSLNKQSLETFFASPEDYTLDGDTSKLPESTAKVIEALRLRQNVVRASKGKLDRMHYLAGTDGRVKDQHVYYGAHTGRWSGRALQPHNFPRGHHAVDPEIAVDTLTKQDVNYEDMRTLAGKWNCSVGDVLSTVTRCCVSAEEGYTLGIVDYSQIECRAVAWLAEERELLNIFAEGRDIYKIMASKIYNKPVEQINKEERFVGKVTVLGAGYGMGWGRFDAQCRISWQINLEASGTNAKECIDAFRRQFRNISGGIRASAERNGIWQRYHDAAHRCIIHDRSETVGKVTFHYEDNCLRITLPSGRNLYYRNARIEDRVPGYCRTLGLDPFTVPTVVFRHPRGYEGTLYGGLITENISQALCRDIVAHALLKLRGRSPTIVHVHDEIVNELLESRKLPLLHEQCKVMTTVPDWAMGFPLQAEGYTSPRWTKKKFKNEPELVYLCGNCIKEH